MEFPFKVKQEAYDRNNGGTLDHIKEVGGKKVTILSSRDEYVCDECQENDGKVVDVEDATIPPVTECQNPVCRCIYIPEEE
jgi:hypothetical protein